jgi:predicted component of type VI protein secretion system
LLQRLETGSSLHVYLLPGTRSALLADVRDAVDPRRSELARALRALPRDAGPTLLVADLVFHARDVDLELLKALGKLAHAHGALLLGGAGPELVGVRGSGEPQGPWDIQPWDHEDWLDFRATAEAESVALALPRILLRAPYGRDAEAIESMSFEELDVPPERDRLLWGNAAFASALLLGQSVGDEGRTGPHGQRLEVPGLPLYAWSAADESGLVTCTEWTVRTDVAGALLKAGLTVFVATGQGDTARLAGFRALGLG